MKTFLIVMIFALLVASASALAPGGELPPESAVAPVKVAEVPGYCEGVVFDRRGDAYISDTRHGKIYRVAADGQTSVWAETGAPNGHKILADGTHLVCDGSRHAVLRLDAAGKIVGAAASESEGKPLRAPNDLTFDRAGGFYFTDPGGSSKENPIGTLHHTDRAGVTRLVASGLAFPNGVVLRPGNRTLLVGESGFNRIIEFELSTPGVVKSKRVFADLPTKQGEQIANAPDGMCLDRDGNLYVAHYGMRRVQVLDPRGKLIRSYPGGNLTTSNVAFGGERLDRLYVTGALADQQTSRGALFRLDLKGVRGLPVLPRR